MKLTNKTEEHFTMTENVLLEGHVVKDRWKVVSKIGQGAFGQVYHCNDISKKTNVALKVFPKDPTSKHTSCVLKLEVEVLKAVKGKEFFASYIGFGKTERFDYIVMELLGPNLHELKRRSLGRRFSFSTAIRLGEMMLKSIQNVHLAGYVHRDVKPANFAIGFGQWKRKILYLIDLGFSRKYVSDDGTIKPPRQKILYRGTPRYSSLSTLQCHEAGRHDDLLSLFYSLYEIFEENLPWKNIKDYNEMLRFREEFDDRLLLDRLPFEFHEFYHHIISLQFEDQPNYFKLYSIFDSLKLRRGINDSDELDFEVLDPLDKGSKIEIDNTIQLKKAEKKKVKNSKTKKRKNRTSSREEDTIPMNETQFLPNESSSKTQTEDGIPPCWSCPTFSLYIRSDLKPPLKQLASINENIFEVDVRRNVAVRQESVDDNSQQNGRRSSLPHILSTTGDQEKCPLKSSDESNSSSPEHKKHIDDHFKIEKDHTTLTDALLNEKWDNNGKNRCAVESKPDVSKSADDESGSQCNEASSLEYRTKPETGVSNGSKIAKYNSSLPEPKNRAHQLNFKTENDRTTFIDALPNGKCDGNGRGVKNKCSVASNPEKNVQMDVNGTIESAGDESESQYNEVSSLEYKNKAETNLSYSSKARKRSEKEEKNIHCKTEASSVENLNNVIFQKLNEALEGAISNFDIIQNSEIINSVLTHKITDNDKSQISLKSNKTFENLKDVNETKKLGNRNNLETNKIDQEIDQDRSIIKKTLTAALHVGNNVQERTEKYGEPKSKSQIISVVTDKSLDKRKCTSCKDIFKSMHENRFVCKNFQNSASNINLEVDDLKLKESNKLANFKNNSIMKPISSEFLKNSVINNSMLTTTSISLSNICNKTNDEIVNKKKCDLNVDEGKNFSEIEEKNFDLPNGIYGKENMNDTIANELYLENKCTTLANKLPLEKKIKTIESKLPLEKEYNTIENELPLQNEYSTIECKLPLEKEYNTIESKLPIEKEGNTIESKLPIEKEYNTIESKLRIEKEYNTDESKLPLAKEYNAVESKLPLEKEYNTIESKLPLEKEYNTISNLDQMNQVHDKCVEILSHSSSKVEHEINSEINSQTNISINSTTEDINTKILAFKINSNSELNLIESNQGERIDKYMSSSKAKENILSHEIEKSIIKCNTEFSQKFLKIPFEKAFANTTSNKSSSVSRCDICDINIIEKTNDANKNADKNSLNVNKKFVLNLNQDSSKDCTCSFKENELSFKMEKDCVSRTQRDNKSIAEKTHCSCELENEDVLEIIEDSLCNRNETVLIENIEENFNQKSINELIDVPAFEIVEYTDATRCEQVNNNELDVEMNDKTGTKINATYINENKNISKETFASENNIGNVLKSENCDPIRIASNSTQNFGSTKERNQFESDTNEKNLEIYAKPPLNEGIEMANSIGLEPSSINLLLATVSGTATQEQFNQDIRSSNEDSNKETLESRDINFNDSIKNEIMQNVGDKNSLADEKASEISTNLKKRNRVSDGSINTSNNLENETSLIGKEKFIQNPIDDTANGISAGNTSEVETNSCLNSTNLTENTYAEKYQLSDIENESNNSITKLDRNSSKEVMKTPLLGNTTSTICNTNNPMRTDDSKHLNISLALDSNSSSDNNIKVSEINFFKEKSLDALNTLSASKSNDNKQIDNMQKSTINSTEKNSQEIIVRRHRRNPDNKYVTDESELKLNFCRKRHRHSTYEYKSVEIYDEKSERETGMKSEMLDSQSVSNYQILSSPSDQPSRRTRYRQTFIQ